MAVDEVPLAYLPGGITRLHVKVVGDLLLSNTPTDSGSAQHASELRQADIEPEDDTPLNKMRLFGSALEAVARPNSADNVGDAENEVDRPAQQQAEATGRRDAYRKQQQDVARDAADHPGNVKMTNSAGSAGLVEPAGPPNTGRKQIKSTADPDKETISNSPAASAHNDNTAYPIHQATQRQPRQDLETPTRDYTSDSEPDKKANKDEVTWQSMQGSHAGWLVQREQVEALAIGEMAAVHAVCGIVQQDRAVVKHQISWVRQAQ